MWRGNAPSRSRLGLADISHLPKDLLYCPGMSELLNICSALGLSGAAGLNAYIPLLTLGIMQRVGMAQLAAPYDALGQWWCLGLLAVLLIIEIIVDKVPGADHLNDILHTAIRPAAGALVFAAQAGHVSWIHPGVWLAAGLVMSGGVHAGKALSRPVVNLGTAGLGAPVVSIIEDFVSATLSIVAVLAPLAAVVLLFVFGWILVKLFRRFFGGWRKEKRIYRVRAVPVEAATQCQRDEPAAQASQWGGGV